MKERVESNERERDLRTAKERGEGGEGGNPAYYTWYLHNRWYTRARTLSIFQPIPLIFRSSIVQLTLVFVRGANRIPIEPRVRYLRRSELLHEVDFLYFGKPKSNGGGAST